MKSVRDTTFPHRAGPGGGACGASRTGRAEVRVARRAQRHGLGQEVQVQAAYLDNEWNRRRTWNPQLADSDRLTGTWARGARFG